MRLAPPQIPEQLDADRLRAGFRPAAAGRRDRRDQGARPVRRERHAGAQRRRDDALHAAAVPADRLDRAQRQALPGAQRPGPARGLPRQPRTPAGHAQQHRDRRRPTRVRRTQLQALRNRAAAHRRGVAAHRRRLAPKSCATQSMRLQPMWEAAFELSAATGEQIETGLSRLQTVDRRDAAVSVLAVGGADPADGAAGRRVHVRC